MSGCGGEEGEEEDSGGKGVGSGHFWVVWWGLGMREEREAGSKRGR